MQNIAVSSRGQQERRLMMRGLLESGSSAAVATRDTRLAVSRIVSKQPVARLLLCVLGFQVKATRQGGHQVMQSPSLVP
eukprot:scaffold246809_cov37-Prasinocladus_malaysianus.AAC.1